MRFPWLTIIYILLGAAVATAQTPVPQSDPVETVETVETTETTETAAPADSLAAATAPIIASVMNDRISPTLAVVVTPVLPGWGQLYADNGWRSVLAWGAQAFYIGNLLRHDREAVRLRKWSQTLPEGSERRLLFDAQVDEEWELMRDYAWWSMGAMLIIALDAYVGAHLHHFDQDPVPVPPLWDPGAEPLPVEKADSEAIPGVVLLQWRAEF